MKVGIIFEVTNPMVIRIASLVPAVRRGLSREAERRGMSVFELLAILTAREVA